MSPRNLGRLLFCAALVVAVGLLPARAEEKKEEKKAEKKAEAKKEEKK